MMSRFSRVSVLATAAAVAAVRPSTVRVASRLIPISIARLAQAQPAPLMQQTRGMKTLDFGGTKELVVERSDYPKDKLQSIFKNDVMAVIGYGPQGRAQALNMKDHGLNVIIGVRKDGASWKAALDEGWVPNKTLFEIEEAANKGTVILYLLSDAAQKESWPAVKKYVTKGKTLYFSHGFSVVYKDQTGVIPPNDVDVVLVAPKGSGVTVRRLFQNGKGINSSVAVFQDVSGKAKERAFALGVAVGSGYLYETTFEKEVYSDLTGERGILMGAIYGLFKAQYDVLRAKGHTPSEAFNETVEEATQSLYPLIGEKGMDWMYSNCSTTAQRGALDWYPKFYEANKPLFDELYKSVEEGHETRRSIEMNGRPGYREFLEKELKQIREEEMWRAGETVRKLRP